MLAPESMRSGGTYDQDVITTKVGVGERREVGGSGLGRSAGSWDLPAPQTARTPTLPWWDVRRPGCVVLCTLLGCSHFGRLRLDAYEHSVLVLLGPWEGQASILLTPAPLAPAHPPVHFSSLLPSPLPSPMQASSTAGTLWTCLLWPG